MNQIYLNNATTSFPKPDAMKARFCEFVDKMNFLGGRGGGAAAAASGKMLTDVRTSVAGLFGSPRIEDIIFTRGTTEGISLVLKGFLKRGDRVFISPMEHNAVSRPLNRLANERGISYSLLPADDKGKVSWDEARKLAESIGEPALIVLIHISSVNAVVQDVAKAREAFPDIPILLDAAQSAGVIPINIKEMGIDFLACSAHKGLYGPTGVGVCYVSHKYSISPLVDGATRLRAEGTFPPNVRPDMFEAGTPNLHGIAALQGSIEYLAKTGLSGAHKAEMASLLTDKIISSPKISIFSPIDGSQIFVCLRIIGTSPMQAMEILFKKYGIVCRAGVQCAELAHKHLGTFPEGTVRLSPGEKTTGEEIEYVARSINEIANQS